MVDEVVLSDDKILLLGGSLGFFGDGEVLLAGLRRRSGRVEEGVSGVVFLHLLAIEPDLGGGLV